jgi:hypothetical protein
MLDLDPRDHDPRDDERLGVDDRGGRDSSDMLNTSGDWRQPDSRERDHDPRWDRDRDPRERSGPREPFTRDLNLPRGLERELVRERDREYTLRGSEARTLATVGAFRVVSSRDLRDHHDRPLDPRSSDLRHLREQRLVETVRLPGSREYAVALTREGRGLLEHHRERDQGAPDLLDGRQTRAGTRARPPGLSRLRTRRGVALGA